MQIYIFLNVIQKMEVTRFISPTPVYYMYIVFGPDKLSVFRLCHVKILLSNRKLILNSGKQEKCTCHDHFL